MITSLMDIDVYKLYMLQYYWYYRYTNYHATFQVICRKGRLRDCISSSELRRILDNIKDLAISDHELNYLASLMRDGQYIFQPEFLEYLRTLELSEYTVELGNNDDYDIRFSGRLGEVTLWETLALSDITECYYDNYIYKNSMSSNYLLLEEGVKRLLAKVHALMIPSPSIIDFVTRRRRSHMWHDLMLDIILNGYKGSEYGSFLSGTSNVHFAMKYGLPVIGTMAHELDMFLACLTLYMEGELSSAPSRVAWEWQELYPKSMRIYLPDTFGSESVLGEISEYNRVAELVFNDWAGVRIDSGDPMYWVGRWVEEYKKRGVDLDSVSIVPSDGLSLEDILNLDNTYGKVAKLKYGWGTGLGNDMGLPKLSIVAKLVEACGIPAVKLSDTAGKHVGPSDYVDMYKKAFHYNDNVTGRKMEE